MSYLLDSNAFIALMGNRPPEVRLRYALVTGTGTTVATSSIVLFELVFGAHKSANPKDNLDRLYAALKAKLDVLPFDQEDGATAGKIRAELSAKGKTIGPFDVLIAGQALRRGLTLVTANVGEFKRVKGLSIENWETP